MSVVCSSLIASDSNFNFKTLSQSAVATCAKSSLKGEHVNMLSLSSHSLSSPARGMKK